MFDMNILKSKIERFNSSYNPRLKIFLTHYEKEKSNVFQKIIDEFDFIKTKNITFVASGLPFYMFDVLNEKFNSSVRNLNKTKKEIKREDDLFEITFLDNMPVPKQQDNNDINIKLIDYSPLIKTTYHIVKDFFKNLNFEFYDRNVNFEDITDLTKDSLIVIPYSEYLYILSDLQVFNKGQYVLVFNQKDDDERRKVNTVLCNQDLIDQCNFEEVIFSERYDISDVRMFVVLGKV